MSSVFFIILLINLSTTELFGFRILNHNCVEKSKSRYITNIKLQAATTLTPDGGVVKDVIIPGQGKRIEPGDILAIEYDASIKGSQKPFAKGDREQVIVRDGSLIKGWDLAVDSMRIGEKAKIICSAPYAYGEKGIANVIPANAEIEINIKVLAWLGNQLRPESLFQKDLDIDPFIASTPEAIQAEYDDMQAKKVDKYAGNILEIYIRRIKNISFGFGGSGFFTSQSGEKAPWYLNPNLTFPAMITIVIVAFITVFSTGSVKEKGASKMDLEVAQVQSYTPNNKLFI
eukprot:gene5858-8081_t